MQVSTFTTLFLNRQLPRWECIPSRGGLYNHTWNRKRRSRLKITNLDHTKCSPMSLIHTCGFELVTDRSFGRSLDWWSGPKFSSFGLNFDFSQKMPEMVNLCPKWRTFGRNSREYSLTHPHGRLSALPIITLLIEINWFYF